jgi:hypothetical protein
MFALMRSSAGANYCVELILAAEEPVASETGMTVMHQVRFCRDRFRVRVRVFRYRRLRIQGDQGRKIESKVLSGLLNPKPSCFGTQTGL